MKLFATRFNLVQQIALLEDMNSFTRAGLPPFEAVESMLAVAKRRKRKRLQECFGLIIKRMSAGKSFAQSVQGLVDGTVGVMLAAGEQSGNLGGAALEGAGILRVRQEMKSLLMGSFIPMLVQLIMLTALIYFIAMQVVPVARGILPEEKMSFVSRAYFAFGEAYVTFAPWVLLGLVLLIVLIVATLGTWAKGLRTRVDGIFPWSMYRQMQAGSLLLTISSMMRAGIPFVQALEEARLYCSPWMRHRINIMRSHLARGKNEAQALGVSGVLPPAIDDRLQVYCKLPDFSVIMQPLAKEAIEASKAGVRKFAALVSTAVMAAVAIFIVFTIFGLGSAAMSAADAARQMSN